MAIHPQMNLRVRSGHRTLLNVLYGAAGLRSQAGAAEASFRLMAESLMAILLAQRRPDPNVEVLLAAMNAAAQEAHPISSGPWYQLDQERRLLQRWSQGRREYEDITVPVEIPQVRIRRR